MAQSMAQSTQVRRIVDLSEVGLADVGLVGGKGANLGEMIAAGFPVPPGFVVTAEAYLDAMELAGLRDELAEHARNAGELTPEDLAAAARNARASVSACTLPASLADDVLGRLDALGPDVRVAVRSSATAEDSTDTSFAGMNETFTNVRGADVLARITDCWASLFGERVAAYRVDRGLFDEPAIAVVVEQMVASDRSGVMFTVDPAERGHVVIEAAFGLGEVVVSGRVEPDTYHVDRATQTLRDVRIGCQSVQITTGPDGDVLEELDELDRLATRPDRRRDRPGREPRSRNRTALRQSARRRVGIRRRPTVHRPVATADHARALDGRAGGDTDPAGSRCRRPPRVRTRAHPQDTEGGPSARRR